MSWLYRFFKKADNEASFNIASGVSMTMDSGDLTLTSGTMTITAGNATLTSGNLTLTSGNGYIGGYLTTTSTGRIGTSPLYLGSGTVGIAWGTAIDPWKGQAVTIPSLDKGSLYIQTTYGTVYTKIGYATTGWATVTATTS